MTFENLHKDTKCDCLNEAIVDTANEYVRRLKKDALQDIDFVTHWERGIRTQIDDCDNTCSDKSVSINLFKKEYETLIVNKYTNTFKINPKKGAHLLKFKLKEKAGKVKSAPEDDDRSHFNFFKADTFILNNLEIIEIVKFA